MTTNQGTAPFTLTADHARQVTAEYTSYASLDPPRNRTFDVALVDVARVGFATTLPASGRDPIRFQSCPGQASPRTRPATRRLGAPLLECTAAGRGGYHRPADQAIGLAEGKAANHSVHTLIHELAHALLAAHAAVPRANENAMTSGWRAK